MNDQIAKNEIDDILNTIVHYKMLIIGTIIVFVSVAYLYAFFIQKAIYKADILIKIAQNNTHIIENEESLAQILLTKYQVDNSKNKPMPFISNVVKPKYSKGVIRIYADGYDKTSLDKLLKEKFMELTVEHNLSVQTYIKDQKKIISNTQENIYDLERQRDNFLSQNKVMESQLDKSLNCAYAISILRNDNAILELNSIILKQKNFLVALNTTIKDNRTFSTKIKGEMHLNPETITPSKKLIVILGLVSGLLFSILLSLFLQFLRDRRE